MGRYNYSDPVSPHVITKGYRLIREYSTDYATLRCIERFNPVGKFIRRDFTVQDTLSNWKKERIASSTAVGMLRDMQADPTYKASGCTYEKIVVNLDEITQFVEITSKEWEALSENQ